MEGLGGARGEAAASGDPGGTGEFSEMAVFRFEEVYMLDGTLGTGGSGLSPYISMIASIVVDFGKRVPVRGMGSPLSSIEEDNSAVSPEIVQAIFRFCGTVASSVKDDKLSGEKRESLYCDLSAILTS